MLCTRPPPKPPPMGLLRSQPGAPSTTNGGWSSKVATAHTEGHAAVVLLGPQRGSVCTTSPLVEGPFPGFWSGTWCSCFERCVKVTRWRADLRAWPLTDELDQDDELPAPLCALLRFSSFGS
jgi:hypothetical protein